jgi:hypothetical protein
VLLFFLQSSCIEHCCSSQWGYGANQLGPSSKKRSNTAGGTDRWTGRVANTNSTAFDSENIS